MAIDLAIRNADYTLTEAARIKSRDLYDGTETVRAKATDYLFQGKNEDDDLYERRLARAVLDPYVEKIVTARQALLFRREHTRKLPTRIEEWVADVDRCGTSAGTFFGDCAQDAQIDGIHWVLVDMPTLPAGGYRSAAEERKAGHRPFFEHVPGANVIDWVSDPVDNQLLWAVIEEVAPDPRTEPGTTYTAKYQWKVWTRYDWAVYQVLANTQGSQDAANSPYAQVAGGPNPIRTVPLVPFHGIRHTDWSGWPVARSVLDHIVLIYNKQSDLDWYEMLGAHPVPWVIAPDPPSKLDVTRGLHIRPSPDVQVNLGYLEPSGAGFQSIRDSILQLERKIYAIALSQALKDTAQVESSDTQRENRRAFSSSLMTASRLYERAEARCWELWARWINETGQIEISYNRDFDDVLIEGTMVATLNSLADSGRLTDRTLLEILQEGERLPATFDVDEELAQLEEQKASQAAATLAAMKSVPTLPVLPGKEA